MSEAPARNPGTATPRLSPDGLSSVPTTLDVPTDCWHWGLATAERVLRWWGRALVECVGMVDAQSANDAFETLANSQRLVARLWREYDEYMQSDDLDLCQRADRLNAFYRTLGNDLLLYEAIRRSAEEIAALAFPYRVTWEDLVQFTLAIEVTSSVLAWADSSEGDPPFFRYRQVTPAARSIVDIGDTAKDPRWSSRKLYGERWGHFGGFATSKGRDADWLWGRLDGASALSDYLLTNPDGSSRVGQQQADTLRATLADAILAAERCDRRQFVDRAQAALNTEPGDLLNDMSADERRTAAALLWRQATAVLESEWGIKAGGGSP